MFHVKHVDRCARRALAVVPKDRLAHERALNGSDPAQRAGQCGVRDVPRRRYALFPFPQVLNPKIE